MRCSAGKAFAPGPRHAGGKILYFGQVHGKAASPRTGKRVVGGMSDNPVTLDFLAEQMRRFQADVRMLRDDMDVVAAIVRRLDHGIARLETNQALMLDELRAMHAQQQRTAVRVRALEEQASR